MFTPITNNQQPTTALSIAGFDPCAGAGVLADVKTFEQHAVQGFGVNTANTYQNDTEFDGLDWCTEQQIVQQIEVLQRRFQIDFAKIGLIENLLVLKAVIAQLKKQGTQIIWDPVLKASAGFEFHSELDKSDLVKVLEECYLITPNKDEYEILNEICEISSHCHVLLKGGHAVGVNSVDILFAEGKEIPFSNTRLNASKHGSGCVLSAAITANLAKGFKLEKAIKNAKGYITQYLNSTDTLLGHHKGLQTLVKEISNLQFITQEAHGLSHSDICKNVVESGVDWVQLRMKEVSDAEYIAEAIKCKTLCAKHNSTFILNDRVDIALEVDADGVHLGKNDMKPSDARKLLGDDKIIGGTANTFEDIQHLVKQGVDYVGLGPFRFTETKKNLSPVLGLEGYSEIIKQCHQSGVNIPVVAIGGIQLKDIEAIKSTGIFGIAVSGLIVNTDDRNKRIKEIKQAFSSQLSAISSQLSVIK